MKNLKLDNSLSSRQLFARIVAPFLSMSALIGVFLGVRLMFSKHYYQDEVIVIDAVDINPNSTVFSDVLAILHNHNRAEVCVHFKQGSRCPHPSLVGRLSGKTVAMLKWSQSNFQTVFHKGVNITDSSTTYCGSYADEWLTVGTYFLEIIIINCNGFGVTTLDRILSNPNHTMTEIQEWHSFDFTYECVEDPTKHRLTGDATFLTFAAERMGTRDFGHWVLSNASKYNDFGFIPQPWFTRFQPQECRKRINDYCRLWMDNSRIHEYFFSWNKNQKWIEAVNRLQIDLGVNVPETDYTTGMINNALPSEFDQVVKKRIEDGTNTNYNFTGNDEVFTGSNKICLVGDSHSWHLIKAMYRLKLGHRFIYVPLTYPITDISEKERAGTQFVASIDIFRDYYFKRNCTRFVIGLGQWPPSDNAMENYGAPFSFEQFRVGMSKIVKHEYIYRIGNDDIRIYLQNIHHDPLGDRMNGCGADGKPNDWRVHTVIDGYNYVLKQIVSEM